MAQSTIIEATQTSHHVTPLEQILQSNGTKLPEHQNYTVGMEVESIVTTTVAGEYITQPQSQNQAMFLKELFLQIV